MASLLCPRGISQIAARTLLAASFFYSAAPALSEKCSTAVAGTSPAMATAAGRMAAQTAPAQVAATLTTVERYLYDATLHRSWAMVRDCSHPERPAWLLPTDDAIPDAAMSQAGTVELQERPHAAYAKTGVWVRGGARVVLWRTSGDVQIQLTGIALESAPLGAELAVRIGMQGAVVRGIVRGPDSVELITAPLQWGQP